MESTMFLDALEALADCSEYLREGDMNALSARERTAAHSLVYLCKRIGDDHYKTEGKDHV
jgi:hypothetical protein